MRWDDEKERWLAERYGAEPMPRLVAAFNERFGEQATKRALWQKAYSLGLNAGSKRAPVKLQRRVRWSQEPEMNEWMLAHDEGQPTAVLSAEFVEAFGFALTCSQVSLWRSANGRQHRPSRGGGKPALPVGSERRRKTYTLVKVAEHPTVPQSKDNWRMKHVLVYEKAFGPVPDGYDVVMANGDRDDFRPENLVAVPHRLMGRLNSPDTPEWHDADSLRAAVAYCELDCAIAAAEMRKPRRCGVCGKEFTPQLDKRGEKSQRSVQTCPECRAAGKKARGKRNSCGMRACAVCGRAFAAERKAQRRCPECIAKAPKLAAAQQIRKNSTQNERNR